MDKRDTPVGEASGTRTGGASFSRRTALAMGALMGSAVAVPPARAATDPAGFDQSTSILQRHKTRVRFSDPDVDFTFVWTLGVGDVVGLSTGELFNTAAAIGEDDPAGWRAAFSGLGARLDARSQALKAQGAAGSAGMASLSGAYAHRAALQYTEPTAPAFTPGIAAMEAAFQAGLQMLRAPVRPVEIAYGGASLPGYFLEIDARPRPTLIMIGGGDTFREDLFYFAGLPGWRRDYNVLMVDLPGQGKAPARGLHFEDHPERSIAVVIDWLMANAATPPTQIALYGVSGGGHFTARAAAADRRIGAWIASTPIFDIGEFWRQEISKSLKDEGPPSKFKTTSFAKYTWQFGEPDFAVVVKRAMEGRAGPVDTKAISCPSLFLVGENEGAELKRQSHVLARELNGRGVPCTLVEFTADEGADAHCQVNNLRLAHLTVFDWLDRTFGRGDVLARADGRLLI